MQMISSRTIPFLDDQTLAPGNAREALFRDERCGFLLYLSDDLTPSDSNERIIRLDAGEALIWLSRTAENGESFAIGPKIDCRQTHTFLKRGNHPMRDVQKITEIAISTTSSEPLRGIVEINTGANSTMKLELSEDMAHHFSTQLDRFLTQRRQQRDRLARSR